MFKTMEEVHQYLDNPRLICLVCGKDYMLLANHTKRKHDIDELEYKIKFGIPVTFPLAGTLLRDHLRDKMNSRLQTQEGKNHIDRLKQAGRTGRAKAKQRGGKLSYKNGVVPAVRSRITDQCILNRSAIDKYNNEKIESKCELCNDAIFTNRATKHCRKCNKQLAAKRTDKSHKLHRLKRNEAERRRWREKMKDPEVRAKENTRRAANKRKLRQLRRIKETS